MCRMYKLFFAHEKLCFKSKSIHIEKVNASHSSGLVRNEAYGFHCPCSRDS